MDKKRKQATPRKPSRARASAAKAELDASPWTEGIAAVAATDLRNNAHGILGRVEHGGEEIILTRHGKPAAVLVSVAVLQAIRDFEESRDIAAAAAARRDIAKHGTIPWAEVKRRNGL